MTIATTIRMSVRDRNGSWETSLSAITMISALRIRSVRIAPEVIFFSASGPRSAAGSLGAWSLWDRCSITFSAPSKHRYVPPSISSGVSNHGANWLRIRATGRMISNLLRSEPIAIFLMIGSSRLGFTPCTNRGVTAVSSTTTPAALALARPAAPATSSTLAAVNFASAAMSSSSAASPAAIRLPQSLCSTISIEDKRKGRRGPREPRAVSTHVRGGSSLARRDRYARSRPLRCRSAIAWATTTARSGPRTSTNVAVIVSATRSRTLPAVARPSAVSSR